MKTLTALLTVLTLSLGVSAAEKENARDDIPKTILVKKDQNGNVTVYRSSRQLQRVTDASASYLDEIPFENLSSLSGKLKFGKTKSSIDELDNDKPRQSWYYWGYYWNYYPAYYVPVYYVGYTYYPYYYYNWNGCNYYWYRPYGPY